MPRLHPPQSRCVAGVARSDITPPVGIYHRMWGAATHDRSTGVHRPLTATVLYLENPQAADEFQVVVAVDHCLLRPPEFQDLQHRVAAAAELPRERFVVFCSHTHAAGLMGYERCELPGGECIPPYLEQLAADLAALTVRARAAKQAASIVYGWGRCSLGANRDYYDEQQQRYVCGYNPRGVADDTVLTARLTGSDSQPLATIVNYACHPTTLAWENTVISPDYVGAMREVVETATGVPCLFIQGASADVGPREGFVGDLAVADRNGRQLGYAALAVWESLPAPETSYEYAGAVISGATLGIWKHVSADKSRRQACRTWQACQFVVPLPYRQNLPSAADLERERARWQQEERSARAAGDTNRARDARAMAERMTRGLLRIGHLPPGDCYPYIVRIWRLGDAIWLALSGEHYNILQRQLRTRFGADTPLVIGTLANAYDVSYLLDRDSFGKGLYQEDVSILAPGALETLIEAIADQIDILKAHPEKAREPAPCPCPLTPAP
jgi:hypothetical protein